MNGSDHLVAKRSGCTPERQKKRTEKDRSETTALNVESPPKENPCTLPTAESVDVGVKKDLVRTHVVALKDDGESVVFRVETLVAPVGIDRSSRGRESATRAACAGRGGRARGRTRARKTRCLATCVTAMRAAVVANRRVAGVGERESTWGVRTRESDDLVLHLVEQYNRL